MKADIYLVVQAKKSRYIHNEKELGTVRVCKTKPNVAKDEISVKIGLNIPDSLFEKPSLKMDVTIPDETPFGSEIPVKVKDDLSRIIKEQTGMNVIISQAEEDADHE